MCSGGVFSSSITFAKCLRTSLSTRTMRLRCPRVSQSPSGILQPRNRANAVVCIRVVHHPWQQQSRGVLKTNFMLVTRVYVQAEGLAVAYLCKHLGSYRIPKVVMASDTPVPGLPQQLPVWIGQVIVLMDQGGDPRLRRDAEGEIHEAFVEVRLPAREERVTRLRRKEGLKPASFRIRVEIPLA